MGIKGVLRWGLGRGGKLDRILRKCMPIYFDLWMDCLFIYWFFYMKFNVYVEIREIMKFMRIVGMSLFFMKLLIGEEINWVTIKSVNSF